MQPIRVQVEYGFAEYKAIVREAMLRALENKNQADRRRPWNTPWILSLTLNVLLPPVFWLKKSLVGKCMFEFTPQGFSRTSKGRTASRSWEQVAAVQRLSAAYVIELQEGGALPVPYRTFTPADRDALESILPKSAGPGDA